MTSDDAAAEEDGEEEAAFLPDGDADEETTNLSPAVLALMRKQVFQSLKVSSHAHLYCRLQQGPASQDAEKEPTCTKIYYASRTHSQLSQVLHELHKLKIKINVVLPPANVSPDEGSLRKRPASTMDCEDSGCDDAEGSGPRAVSLGSRKQLCIHDRLREKAVDLDEACRQMLGGASRIWTCRNIHSRMQRREGKEAVSTLAVS